MQERKHNARSLQYCKTGVAISRELLLSGLRCSGVCHSTVDALALGPKMCGGGDAGCSSELRLFCLSVRCAVMGGLILSCHLASCAPPPDYHKEEDRVNCREDEREERGFARVHAHVHHQETKAPTEDGS